MSNQTTTGMTTQEKVELICTNMMGWEKVTYNKGWRNKATVLFLENPLGKRTKTIKFNPYENWEDCHTVLDKVMEDQEMWEELCELVSPHTEDFSAVYTTMKASKETLMDALLSILSTPTS